MDSSFTATILQLPELFFILTCLCLGLVSGFLGGLLGIGGGVVIVPGLLALFTATARFSDGSATLVALGSSLAIIVFTSIAATRAQIRAGNVLWPVFRLWVGWLIAGALCAGYVASWLDPATLRGLIGLFLVAVGAIMLTQWQPAPHAVLPGRLGGAGLASGSGLVSGLAGIGGGNVIVPLLTYFNVPIHRATATASAFGIPVAAAGAIGYSLQGVWSGVLLGKIYLPVVAIVAAGAVIAAPIGVRSAQTIQPARLKRYFGILLLCVALRMLWSARSLLLS